MWIESHQSLLTHRKTGRLSRALSVSKITAIGHLHAFWWWCMDNAPTGSLTGVDAEDIADGACWEGEPGEFLAGLIHAGFVDSDGDSVAVHDWHEFAGKLIEKRASDAARKRESRQKSAVHGTSTGHPRDGAGTGPDRTRPDLTEPFLYTDSGRQTDRPRASVGAPASVEAPKQVGRSVGPTLAEITAKWAADPERAHWPDELTTALQNAKVRGGVASPQRWMESTARNWDKGDGAPLLASQIARATDAPPLRQVDATTARIQRSRAAIAEDDAQMEAAIAEMRRREESETPDLSTLFDGPPPPRPRLRIGGFAP